MKKILSILLLSIIFFINLCHSQTMAYFDFEKKHDNQILNFKKDKDSICNKNFDKKGFVTCCNIDFWFGWIANSSFENKHKKISLSFIDIDNDISTIDFLNIFWNIWPPKLEKYFAWIYNYISLIWIIKSNR